MMAACARRLRAQFQSGTGQPWRRRALKRRICPVKRVIIKRESQRKCGGHSKGIGISEIWMLRQVAQRVRFSSQRELRLHRSRPLFYVIDIGRVSLLCGKIMRADGGRAYGFITQFALCCELRADMNPLWGNGESTIHGRKTARILDIAFNQK